MGPPLMCLETLVLYNKWWISFLFFLSPPSSSSSSSFLKRGEVEREVLNT